MADTGLERTIAGLRDVLGIVGGGPGPAALTQIIEDGGKQMEPQLVKQITGQLPLAAPLVKSVVSDTLSQTEGQPPAQQAALIAKNLTGAFSTPVDVELANPAMLSDAARRRFSTGFMILTAGCVAALGLLAATDALASTTTEIALAVLGALSALAALVLVMGYKNVVVKVGSSASN